jgi:DNA-binding response OmpR family regulator
MPRRRKMTPSGAEANTPANRECGGEYRVLIVASSAKASARIAKSISNALPGAQCEQAEGIAAARAAIAERVPGLAIVDCELRDGSGFELAEALGGGGGCGIIMLAAEPSFDLATRALRAGAIDLVPSKAAAAGGDEFVAAIARAVHRTAAARRRDDRVRRLSDVCRKLSETRREMSTHVSGLCGDMVTAFQELADQVNHITIASEFKGLIRQELDVESLLRTALEYVLAKCGSTNAAVFLPSGSGEYSLGAYVNYDCPKEALDMMLEHLAGVVAPRMEDATEMRLLPAESDLQEFLGDDAHWLADCGAVTFACRDQDECLAVVILFRDRRTPFSPAALETLRIISGIFGQQLARIVRIHHRHLPKEQWGTWGEIGFADEGEDDIDLAA